MWEVVEFRFGEVPERVSVHDSADDAHSQASLLNEGLPEPADRIYFVKEIAND